jgi:hypothetical protein
METVLSLIELVFDQKKVSQLPKLLDLCKKMMEVELDERKVDSLLEKLQRTEGGSVDLYVIMKMLHGKVKIACVQPSLTPPPSSSLQVQITYIMPG